jgi:hypothetical protein
MPTFFPRQTLEIHHFEEPKAFRRFSFSLWEMALVTGIMVRLYRAVILTFPANNWIYVSVVFAVGMMFLLGMLTAHLANYPLHQYLWRAPAFAAIEVAAEMATSALLIVVGREPIGTVRAHWNDWIGMGLNALLIRGLAIILWGLIVAGVVQLVRRAHIVEEEEEPDEAAEVAARPARP